MIGTLKKMGVDNIHYRPLYPQQHARTHQRGVHGDVLASVSFTIPYFNEKFDPHAYIY
jgi:hypothetical protein